MCTGQLATARDKRQRSQAGWWLQPSRVVGAAFVQDGLHAAAGIRGMEMMPHDTGVEMLPHGTGAGGADEAVLAMAAGGLPAGLPTGPMPPPDVMVTMLRFYAGTLCVWGG